MSAHHRGGNSRCHIKGNCVYIYFLFLKEDPSGLGFFKLHEKRYLVVSVVVVSVVAVVDLLADLPGDLGGDVAADGDVDVLADLPGHVVRDLLGHLLAVVAGHVEALLVGHRPDHLVAVGLGDLAALGVLHNLLVLDGNLLAHAVNLKKKNGTFRIKIIEIFWQMDADCRGCEWETCRM